MKVLKKSYKNLHQNVCDLHIKMNIGSKIEFFSFRSNDFFYFLIAFNAAYYLVKLCIYRDNMCMYTLLKKT
jgi:hypothetical protein